MCKAIVKILGGANKPTSILFALTRTTCLLVNSHFAKDHLQDIWQQNECEML
jgi:hypothetical protein